MEKFQHRYEQEPSALEAGEGRRGFSQPQPEPAQDQHVSDEQSAEEFRKAEEALERKKTSINKMLETRIRNKTLTPEERHEKQLEYYRDYRQANKEKVQEWQRTTRQRRKERKKLQREQQQPTQVFPRPANE
jgi:hypothetical protein